ncbi:MAG: hypothetical protein ABI639_04690 [Thermoanaerobaculia bacterium]
MADEREHLQFLSMFFYAVGALAAMLSLIPALAVFVAAMLREPGEAPPSPWLEAIGLPLATGIVMALLVAGFALGISMARAGYCLARCQRFSFCRRVAMAACSFIPIGTFLGMITLSILARPATRDLFADGSVQNPQSPPKPPKPAIT